MINKNKVILNAVVKIQKVYRGVRARKMVQIVKMFRMHGVTREQLGHREAVEIC